MKILTNKIFAKFLSANLHVTKEDHTGVDYYKRGTPLLFEKFEEIANEAFGYISSLRGEASFGILEINKNLAREMAKIQGAYVGVLKSGVRFWGHSLQLPKLKSISTDCLKELAKFQGTLKLNGLESLSDNEASILFEHKGAVIDCQGTKFKWCLELNNLKYFSEKSAKSLGKYKGASIALNSLKDITEQTAIALSKYNGKLALEAQGMRNPEMVYMHLKKHCGIEGNPELLKSWGNEMIKCSVCRCEVYPSEIPSGRKNLIARTFDGDDTPSGKYWDKCDPCLWEELISTGKLILNDSIKKKDGGDQLYKVVKKKAPAKKKAVKKVAKKAAKKKTANPIEGMKFVITGKLPLMGRAEATEIIKDNGGKVVASISKNTDYLLSGEKTGTKLDKAKALGVKIITEQKLLKMLPQ